jgi:polar amino acid transport system substrate-binding protein
MCQIMKDRMIYFKYLIFSVLLIFSQMTTANKNLKEIILVGDPWCPYNCKSDTLNSGYLIELAEIAFKENGYSVKYEVMPWSRAINEVLNGRADGLVGVGKNEVPALIFPSIPQGVAKHTFFTLPEYKWRYSTLKSLSLVTLGVIQDYSYGNLYEDYIEFNENNKLLVHRIAGLNSINRLVNTLVKKRVDVIIEDANVLNYYIKNNNLNITLAESGVAYEEDIFIGFSPKNKEAKILAEILVSEQLKLRESKRLNEILASYGIKDWK